MSKNLPRAVPGVAGCSYSRTLDKMMRDRKHLVSAEVDKLIAAVKGTRNAAQDCCILLPMFRHGLCVSEARELQLSQVDIESRTLHIARLKQGLSTTYPLKPDEIRAIKARLAECAKMEPNTEVFFVSERRGPLSRETAWLMVDRYA